MDLLKILETLKNGENDITEFKGKVNDTIAKEICAFANSNGGNIYIGVTDNGNPVGIQEDSSYVQKHSDILQGLRPYPNITYDDLKFDNKKIVVVSVQKSPYLIAYKNIVYVRVGANNYPLSIPEVLEKSAEGLQLYFDQAICNIKSDNLSDKLMLKYFSQREKERGVHYDNKNLLSNLESMNLVRKMNTNDTPKLTNAAILCFTENPQNLYPNTSVKLSKFLDDEMQKYIERLEFKGSLLEIVEQLDKYFISNISKIGGYVIGFKNREYYEYPMIAIRESVINAIVHRNYYDPGDTQIFIFPNRIEIRNPGGFPLGVSQNNPIHKPRNPTIAQLFFDYGYTDKNGSGIKKIIKATKEHPFANVLIESVPYMTKITFTRNIETNLLDERSKKILELLSIGPKSITEIANYIGLSRQATLTRLKKLETVKMIKIIGLSNNTKYMNNE